MRRAVMGIVNVTPDSFSDGGRFMRPEEAVRRARNLLAEGADLIDFGGESTRPDATPLSWEEEWSRLEPVLKAFDGPASVDTYHPETAERALALGAKTVNCVRAESVPAMAALCARSGAELVIPYRLSAPETLAAAERAGMTEERLYLDPMIGFGTTRDEDVALLGTLREIARVGRVLVGVSRKRIVRRLSGEHGVGRLLGGSVALALWCAAHGASTVRVHDVRETVEALSTWTRLGEFML